MPLYYHRVCCHKPRADAGYMMPPNTKMDLADMRVLIISIHISMPPLAIIIELGWLTRIR